MSEESTVTIKIIDSTGAPVMQFPATKMWSISEDAAKAGFEIPTSCCAWACFVCAWRIKQWWECIDIGKISVPLIDIDEDQVLTCVWGIYDRCFDDGLDHEVIIEKDI
jgi:ferredoxin